ncbi:transcription antitermination protein NusB [Flavobacterium filum]|uniref:transcription antitermination protein NusB n=2 Tax=Flavobacterium filum TaxID=370974 RepID=UPI00047B9865|nr:transcription antitermination protein NusB [Flavobacterium filum]
MLNRRHIRVKILQTIYAMHQSGSEELEKEEKFLFSSLESIQNLYLIMVSVLMEIRRKEEEFLEIAAKKHLATEKDKNPNKKFIKNRVLVSLDKNNLLADNLEKFKIINWKQNDDMILLLLEETKKSKLYIDYLASKENSFEDDKQFVAKLFEEVIATNDKLFDYLEDFRLTWVDDIPLVNTMFLKQLKTLEESNLFILGIPTLYKDAEDKDFAKDLFRKTVLNEQDLAKEYLDRTPNWDPERISEIDTIMLKMAICEFLRFPSIPIKVTINEYLEIAKEYATPKSSIFINGILDNLVKEYQKTNKLNKTGRGLM